MKSSYKPEDVEILLTDLTDRVNKGEKISYTKEYEMSEEYLNLCKELGKKYIKQTATAVGILAEQLYKYKSNNVVLVSIVRSGIPIGILVKRYLQNKYKKQIYHYAISIKEGIDPKAINYIISKHNVKDIQFVDSWTGKGTVARRIVKYAKLYEGLDSSLAVLSDCINLTKYCGIREDIAIPQAPINACITGIVSVPIILEDKSTYDGAVYLQDLEELDFSEEYIEAVEKEFDYNCSADSFNTEIKEVEEVNDIAEKFNVDISKINPGVNEAARAILRRKVSVLLVKDKNDIQVSEIIELAKLKDVKIEEYDFKYYKASTIAID